MDVLQRPHELSVSFVRHISAHACPILLVGHATPGSSQILSTRTEPRSRTVWVSPSVIQFSPCALWVPIRPRLTLSALSEDPSLCRVLFTPICPIPSAKLTTINRKKVFPTAVATSLDIGLSNLSLKTISLSFYSQWIYMRLRVSTQLTFSDVQIFLAYFRPAICLPLPLGEILMAPNWSYYSHIFGRPAHGRDRNPLYSPWVFARHNCQCAWRTSLGFSTTIATEQNSRTG